MDTSVKACQSGIDLDRAAQRAGECAPRGGALEARQPPARIDAAALERRARRQNAVPGDETDELALGSAAAAPGTGPNRLMGQEDRPPPRCSAPPRPPAPRRYRPRRPLPPRARPPRAPRRRQRRRRRPEPEPPAPRA